jgi:transposase
VGKQQESTRTMMEQFLKLKEHGCTIPEIAEKFGLSWTTVYNALGEIAKENGQTREELLDRPMSPDHSGRVSTKGRKLDLEEFRETANQAKARIEKMEELIDIALTEE